MKTGMRQWTMLVLIAALTPPLGAMDEVRVETRADEATAAFGVTGEGVTIAVLDRGIDWSHPDFVNPDGTTRIAWMLDHSGFSLCDPGNPSPVEYTAAQIDAALGGGPPLALRDAVGHGTATAGTAAGNGRGLPDGRYRGIAPGADLLIVKMTSEGAPAHDGQPAEAPFQGCIDGALDWVAAKAAALDQPLVVIINSGTQWGPMDGTSAVSRKIDELFGADTPGRIVVIPSGDEGSLPNHAGADFDSAAPTAVGIAKASAGFAVMSGWYSGSAPAEITVTFDDGTVVGPVLPGMTGSASGVTIINYAPGTEFYPWLSTSGDRALWIGVDGHATTGSVRIRATGPGTAGHLDLYGDVTGPNLTPVISMTDHLVPGRLNDYAATETAIVVADHVIRTDWIDIDGIPRSIPDEGDVGELWLKSSGGPTRDGRVHGVDLSAPGQNLFASLGPDSWWSTFRSNLPQGSGGLYTRFGGTSGSAPIVVGAVALLLEVDPTLTADEVRTILRATAVADGHTGTLPNADWGFGKLDVYEAVRAVAGIIFEDGFESGDLGGWSSATN
jgi:subtilisin family serine protease